MKRILVIFSLAICLVLLASCNSGLIRGGPHKAERWGIYTFKLETEEIQLVYSTPNTITNMDFCPNTGQLAFAITNENGDLKSSEIYSLSSDGSDLRQLTRNEFLDTYPQWSPDCSKIAFLSFSGPTLDIHLMNADGSQDRQLYDSGTHDADIDWRENSIAFTKDSQIWLLNTLSGEARQITDPDRAGEWGNANLPFGDYDPRISPDGQTIVFERLLDDKSEHGNYDLFRVDINGENEIRLTDSGYAQGLAQWSPSGSRIAYIVSAVNDAGQYDLYMMNADGSGSENITPASFPQEFLIHWVSFSSEDSLVYLIGEWWQE